MKHKAIKNIIRRYSPEDLQYLWVLHIRILRLGNDLISYFMNEIHTICKLVDVITSLCITYRPMNSRPKPSNIYLAHTDSTLNTTFWTFTMHPASCFLFILSAGNVLRKFRVFQTISPLLIHDFPAHRFLYMSPHISPRTPAFYTCGLPRNPLFNITLLSKSHAFDG